MIYIKKITWDFTDTEFEDCSYSEAVDLALLPKCLLIEEDELDSDSERDDVIEYISEEYGFLVKKIIIESED